MEDGAPVLGQSIDGIDGIDRVDQIGSSVRESAFHGAARVVRARTASSPRRPNRQRTAIGGERQATLAQGLRRLEREHVALLLAICELEGPTSAHESPAMREALLILLRDDLSRVQRALTLAADGHYGSCEGCGRAIPRRELELSPATVRCHTCQEH